MSGSCAAINAKSWLGISARRLLELQNILGTFDDTFGLISGLDSKIPLRSFKVEDAINRSVFVVPASGT